MSAQTPIVAAVIVTHNRAGQLGATIAAVLQQLPEASRIVVVDSGSTDETSATMMNAPAQVHFLRFDDNIGPAAGRGEGIRHAYDQGAERFWIVDDDSPPEPGALTQLLEADAALPDAGLIGCRGGTIHFGRIRHLQGVESGKSLPQPRPGLFKVDYALLDGALLRREAVDTAGLPRPDFFIMMEDVEYPLRINKSGLNIYVLRRELFDWQNLGSQPGVSTAAWRSYYQARNYVRMGIDLRRPDILFGAFVRECHFAAVYLPHRKEWSRLRLRWRGVRDAFAGRMGRIIDPNVPTQ